MSAAEKGGVLLLFMRSTNVAKLRIVYETQLRDNYIYAFDIFHIRPDRHHRVGLLCVRDVGG